MERRGCETVKERFINILYRKENYAKQVLLATKMLKATKSTKKIASAIYERQQEIQFEVVYIKGSTQNDWRISKSFERLTSILKGLLS